MANLRAPEARDRDLMSEAVSEELTSDAAAGGSAETDAAADDGYAPVLAVVEDRLARAELVAAAEALGAFLIEHPRHEGALLDLATVQAVAGALGAARATLEAAHAYHPRSSAIATKLEQVYRLLLSGDAATPEVQRGLADIEMAAAARPSSIPAPPPSAHALDLRPFFATDLPYAILRMSDRFPAYAPHSDIDILCADVEAFRSHLRQALLPYEARGYSVREEIEGEHIHVDVHPPGSDRLDLRFDLTDTLSLFERFTVDPAFAVDLLAGRESVRRGEVAAWIPKPSHDLALRFLEYVEWQDRRPEKAKHLEAVDRANDFSFVDVVNGYTDLQLTLDTSTGQATLDLGRKDPGQMIDLAAARARRIAAPRARMDYFMIWGHGLAHTEEILELIRGHGAFRIVSVVRHTLPDRDIARFITRVYEADTVPLHHLLTKTRYLLHTPPEVLFILVRNRDPQERYFGEGAFRHIQCAHVKAVKDAIRDRFNPRQFGRRSENHVIHGSDYESQVRHLLAVLDLPPLEHYTRVPNPRLDAPYHLEPFKDFDIREIPLASLRASILGRGLLPLTETPHWQYLNGDQGPYRAYHATHMGRALTDDHFPAAFDRLLAHFDPDRIEHDGKLQLPLAIALPGGAYRLLDGVHRAAILLHLGHTTMRVAIPRG